jgi:hypothetical protein
MVLSYHFDTGKWRIDYHDGCLSVQEHTSCPHTPTPRYDPLEARPQKVNQGSNLVRLAIPQRNIHIGRVATAQEIERSHRVVHRQVLNVRFTLQFVRSVTVAVKD